MPVLSPGFLRHAAKFELLDKSSKIFCCGGSWMVKGALIDAGDFDKIKELTAEAAEIVKSLR